MGREAPRERRAHLFAVIKEMTRQRSQGESQANAARIAHLTEIARLSRASYYRWLDPKLSAEDDADLHDRIQRLALQRRHEGYRRLTQRLRNEGLVVNAKRVLRLMRADNLLSLRGKPFVAPTTDSRHKFKIVANLARALEPTGLDQLWVADITYVRLAEGFVYLAVIVDAFSRKVVEYGNTVTHTLFAISYCPGSRGTREYADTYFIYHFVLSGDPLSPAALFHLPGLTKRTGGVCKQKLKLMSPYSYVTVFRYCLTFGVQSNSKLKLMSPYSSHHIPSPYSLRRSRPIRASPTVRPHARSAKRSPMTLATCSRGCPPRRSLARRGAIPANETEGSVRRSRASWPANDEEIASGAARRREAPIGSRRAPIS
jgi:hypothetical protein